jgi:hypothetical protein
VFAMSSACTLVLTHGTHVIDDGSAVAVEQALESGAHSVDIQIDMTGSGNVISRARISMAHVIAVIRHQETTSAFIPDDSNVYALRLR